MSVHTKTVIVYESFSPVHTKTLVNENACKRRLFYAFRPSVHTKTIENARKRFDKRDWR